MPKKIKLNLSELNVESFITEKHSQKGGVNGAGNGAVGSGAVDAETYNKWCGSIGPDCVSFENSCGWFCTFGTECPDKLSLIVCEG